jgi:hypothetical protein
MARGYNGMNPTVNHAASCLSATQAAGYAKQLVEAGAN